MSAGSRSKVAIGVIVIVLIDVVVAYVGVVLRFRYCSDGEHWHGTKVKIIYTKAHLMHTHGIILIYE